MSNSQRGDLQNIHTRIPRRDYERIQEICDRLGITQAEYFNSVIQENGYYKLLLYARRMLVMPDGSIEFHLVGNETRTWKDLHLNDFRHVATSTDAFLGKIHCACCGNTYHRSVGKQWVYWYCMGKKKKGCTCDNKNFPDYHLRLISSYVMGTESFDEDDFTQKVEEIRVLAEGRLEYRFADGRTVTWEKA